MDPVRPKPTSFPAGFPVQAQQPLTSPMFSPTGTGFTSMMGSIQGAGEGQPSDASKSTSEENVARLCRIGQELVHEIVHKSADIFHVLKAPQVCVCVMFIGHFSHFELILGLKHYMVTTA